MIQVSVTDVFVNDLRIIISCTVTRYVNGSSVRVRVLGKLFVLGFLNFTPTIPRLDDCHRQIPLTLTDKPYLFTKNRHSKSGVWLTCEIIWKRCQNR